jgi:hypothetical protein
MSDQPQAPGNWESWSARPELMPNCGSDFGNRYWGERRRIFMID